MRASPLIFSKMRLNLVAGLAVDGAVSVQASVVDMGGNLYWQEEGSKKRRIKEKRKAVVYKSRGFLLLSQKSSTD
jgi:hypothetical protein